MKAKNRIKNKRSVFLINPHFQLRFIGFTTLLSAISMSTFLGCNFYFFYSLKKLGFNFGLAEEHPFFTFIKQQQALMNQIFFFSAIILFAIIFLLGLFFSHRIAGPIFRMQRLMSDFSKSDSNLINNLELKFRENDYFPELASSFNAFVRKIKR